MQFSCGMFALNCFSRFPYLSFGSGLLSTPQTFTYSKSTIETEKRCNDVVQVSLLLNLNIFHAFLVLLLLKLNTLMFSPKANKYLTSTPFVPNASFLYIRKPGDRERAHWEQMGYFFLF